MMRLCLQEEEEALNNVTAMKLVNDVIFTKAKVYNIKKDKITPFYLLMCYILYN
jgi:hypothetical protein